MRVIRRCATAGVRPARFRRFGARSRFARPTQPPSPCPPDWEPQICELKAAVEVLKRQHLTDIDIGALLDATTHAGIKTLPYARFFDAKEEQERRDDERRARDGTPGIGIVFETRPDGCTSST